MTTLTIGHAAYGIQPGETVLDTLLREQVNIAYACKKGTCHSCMLRSDGALPPEAAQAGLKSTLKSQGYFLACQCYPEQDMQIRLPNQAAVPYAGVVQGKQLLNPQTILLTLVLDQPLDFHAGQFVQLQRPDGLKRSYSIANLPQPDNKTLVFHIRRLPNGAFSSWVYDSVQVGDVISVSEAHGHCFYLPERQTEGLLLVGTGTGLAPLQGIVLDALAQGHSGPIYLFHGGRTVDDLYHIAEMQALAQQHAQFHYIPCVSGGPVPEGFSAGRVNQVVFQTVTELKTWRVYLCGHPEMVQQMKLQVFLKGAASADIFIDPFVITTP